MHYSFSTLLRYHASTCFDLIVNPSLGGRVNHVANDTLNWLLAGLAEQRPPTVDSEEKQVPMPHSTLHLLIMG
jgi:hypothetical protein